MLGGLGDHVEVGRSRQQSAAIARSRPRAVGQDNPILDTLPSKEWLRSSTTFVCNCGFLFLILLKLLELFPIPIP